MGRELEIDTWYKDREGRDVYIFTTGDSNIHKETWVSSKPNIFIGFVRQPGDRHKGSVRSFHSDGKSYVNGSFCDLVLKREITLDGKTIQLSEESYQEFKKQFKEGSLMRKRLEKGKWYTAKNGKKVYILSDSNQDLAPYTGITNKNIQDVVVGFMANGRFERGGGVLSYYLNGDDYVTHGNSDNSILLNHIINIDGKDIELSEESYQEFKKQFKED